MILSATFIHASKTGSLEFCKSTTHHTDLEKLNKALVGSVFDRSMTKYYIFNTYSDEIYQK